MPNGISSYLTLVTLTMSWVKCFVGVFCLFVLITCSVQTRVFTERAKMEDQTSSASGYMYHADSSGPPTYVHFSDSSGSASYAYPPIPLGHYTAHIPSHYEYELPLGHESYLQYVPKYHADTHFSSYGAATPLIHEFNDYDYDHHHFDHFAEKDYDAEKHAKHGEKEKKGFNRIHAFDKGEHGKYGDEDHRGFHKAQSGKKGGHHEVSEHHGGFHKASKQGEGGAFNKVQGHKKGMTTSGYHKIFNKDEFKKDHSFYDEHDSKGHFDKFGGYHGEHGSKEQEHKKGGDFEHGYHLGHQGRGKFYDKGHHHGKDSEYKKENEGLSYEKESDEFNKDEGHEQGKGYGYKHHGGYHHY